LIFILNSAESATRISSTPPLLRLKTLYISSSLGIVLGVKVEGSLLGRFIIFIVFIIDAFQDLSCPPGYNIRKSKISSRKFNSRAEVTCKFSGPTYLSAECITSIYFAVTGAHGSKAEKSQAYEFNDALL
jgi:hypothetical protein